MGLIKAGLLLGHPAESVLLGQRSYDWRAVRKSDPLQYGRTGFCHDSYVRGNFPGTVAERKASHQRLGRPCGERGLSDNIWPRSVFGPDHDLCSGGTDGIS